MKWPEKPTCHGDGEWSVWKEPRRDDEPYGEPYRTCAYCGSIHPEDLVQALQSGARLEQTDQKYGWLGIAYLPADPRPATAAWPGWRHLAHADKDWTELLPEYERIVALPDDELVTLLEGCS